MRRATKQDIKNMYLSIQEVVCAYIVLQEDVEKAKRSKKSMLKAYQNRDKQLELAFRDCLEQCEKKITDLNIKGVID